MAAIGGFWSGCRNSSRVNEIDCRAINLKTTMLIEYRVFITENPDYFKLTDEEFDALEEINEFNEKQETFIEEIKKENNPPEVEEKITIEPMISEGE